MKINNSKVRRLRRKNSAALSRYLCVVQARESQRQRSAFEKLGISLADGLYVLSQRRRFMRTFVEANARQSGCGFVHLKVYRPGDDIPAPRYKHKGMRPKRRTNQVKYPRSLRRRWAKNAEPEGRSYES